MYSYDEIIYEQIEEAYNEYKVPIYKVIEQSNIMIKIDYIINYNNQ